MGRDANKQLDGRPKYVVSVIVAENYGENYCPPTRY